MLLWGGGNDGWLGKIWRVGWVGMCEYWLEGRFVIFIVGRNRELVGLWILMLVNMILLMLFIN